MKISICIDGECVEIAELKVAPTLATIKVLDYIKEGEVYKVVVALYIEKRE